MTHNYKHILISIIVIIIILILIFLLAAVTRRIWNARKYAALDRQREWYRQKIKSGLQAGTAANLVDDLRTRPASLQWRAIEEVLFEQIANSRHETEIAQLFHQLGYRDYYKDKLKSRRIIIKAAAADKLGKMLSEASTSSLIDILKTEEDPEILTVTVRALCRAGGQEGLKGVLERLPELYTKSLISQKTIEASLISFNAEAVPLLVDSGRRCGDPKVTASLLRALSHLPATPESVDFAAANLSVPDAEVRARAVRVLGRPDPSSDLARPNLLLPLLGDPVWFVRLQAARALERLRYEGAVDALGHLLLDQNWQVRNAAARALANIGNASLDVFLNILKYKDRYAKESICEEAQRTKLTQRLIENLEDLHAGVSEKSREILGIMNSLNFSTALNDYLNSGAKDSIRQEIALLMQETAAQQGMSGIGERPVSSHASRGGGGDKA